MKKRSNKRREMSGSKNASGKSAFDLRQALKDSLRGGPEALDAHLVCLDRDIALEKTCAKLHCYFLPVDAHGCVRVKPLAEFLRNRIIDYAIPRRTIKRAHEEFDRTGSTAPLAALHERAKRLFTDISNTGEGGELLLFVIAETLFGLAQVICKMSLKTSTEMHYHGADGVYAAAHEDGGLSIYWAESKIHKTSSVAIANCFKSLAPFLLDQDGEDAVRDQDILLVNEFSNFTDERLVESLRQFLDKDSPSSLGVHQCGFALVGFDSSSYPSAGIQGKLSDIEAKIRGELAAWVKAGGRRVLREKLDAFDIHIVCVPLPSAEDFRSYFLKTLGVSG